MRSNGLTVVVRTFRPARTGRPEGLHYTRWLVPLGASLLTVVAVARLGAAEGSTRLIDAIKGRDKTAVAALVKKPAEVTLRSADGTTALHWAVRVDDLDTVRLLLRSGA